MTGKIASSSHNVISRASFMAARSSSFLSRISMHHTLSSVGSSQTLHSRRGSRLTVRASADYYSVL